MENIDSWWLLLSAVFVLLLWLAFRSTGGYRRRYGSLKHRGPGRPLVSRWVQRRRRDPRPYPRSDQRSGGGEAGSPR